MALHSEFVGKFSIWFLTLKLFSYLKHFTVVAAFSKVRPGLDSRYKYVRISVYYINDTLVFLSSISSLTIVIIFNYQYSFQKNVTVFIITFPA